VKIYQRGRSSLVAHLRDWTYRQYLDTDTVIRSNSITIEAEISTLRGFLAEITVVDKTGEESSLDLGVTLLLSDSKLN
jgi:hypothetical protein